MVDVIAWPPVATKGRALPTKRRPISQSRSLLTGKRYASATQRARREATVVVGGIGADKASAGYVEMFKEFLDGGINYTRISMCSPLWYGALRGLGGRRGSQALEWMSGYDALEMTESAVDLSWTVGQPVAGLAGTFDGWPILTCTGLPANTVIAFPSETVLVVDGGGVTHTARILRVAKVDAAGDAVLFLDAGVPDGDVLIGYRESVVYEVQDVNDIQAMQPVSGNFSYTINLREVFEDETDGFTEVNPWRSSRVGA
ncbi:hypothetical protein Q8W25_17640 [Shimia thalassica]|uniref:hypothetical protein n=1 Tax=Shimia thalassica TaxID=1715693 RepID=UPI0027349444|nr:hypothetical protein [Shimia thalassica]MDP2495855.1 hypothetical protein [Shimia thalassica]